jgi:hypothetical protein
MPVQFGLAILFPGDGGVNVEVVIASRYVVYLVSLGCGLVVLSDAVSAGYELLFLSIICCYCSLCPRRASKLVTFAGVASDDGYGHPTGHSSVRIESGEMQEKSVFNRRQWLLGVGVVAARLLKAKGSPQNTEARFGSLGV